MGEKITDTEMLRLQAKEHTAFANRLLDVIRDFDENSRILDAEWGRDIPAVDTGAVADAYDKARITIVRRVEALATAHHETAAALNVVANNYVEADQ